MEGVKHYLIIYVLYIAHLKSYVFMGEFECRNIKARQLGYSDSA